MFNYLVQITSDLPYPISKDYTVKASSIGIAINRGYKLYRADITALKGRKRINVLRVSATKI